MGFVVFISVYYLGVDYVRVVDISCIQWFFGGSYVGSQLCRVRIFFFFWCVCILECFFFQFLAGFFFFRVVVRVLVVFCFQRLRFLQRDRWEMLRLEIGLLFDDLRYFFVFSCLFISILFIVMGISIEYSVFGGIGIGKCFLGSQFVEVF